MLTLALTTSTTTALAQGALAPQAGAQRAPDSASRARLENEIRRGVARAVRQRVGLNDEQMNRLGPIAQRFERQRRQLQGAERDARVSLRAALKNERSADPRQVERLLQTMLDVQKQRAQLLDDEQCELATFMTPIQRAKYLALQEQIRRRLEQLRQRRAQLDDGADASDAARTPRRRRLP